MSPNESNLDFSGKCELSSRAGQIWRLPVKREDHKSIGVNGPIPGRKICPAAVTGLGVFRTECIKRNMLSRGWSHWVRFRVGTSINPQISL